MYAALNPLPPDWRLTDTPLGLVDSKPFCLGEARRFRSHLHVDGLALHTAHRLDLIAILCLAPGQGCFRRFIEACKQHYKTIGVWQIENPWLPAVLVRYGFKPAAECIEPDDVGEIVNGYRWDREGHTPCAHN